MKINPNDFSANNATQATRKELSEGIKVFVPLGARHGTFKTGTRYIEIGHVCIETDKNPEQEVGCTHYVRFPLMDNMLWAIGNYAYAIGYRKEFDPEDINDVQNVLMTGPIKIKLEDSDYGLQAKKYFPHNVERDSDGNPVLPHDVIELIIKAEQWCMKAFEKAVQREGGSYTKPRKKDNDGYDPNSEVPF